MLERKPGRFCQYWHIPLFVCVLLAWTALLSLFAPHFQTKHRTQFSWPKANQSLPFLYIEEYNAHNKSLDEQNQEVEKVSGNIDPNTRGAKPELQRKQKVLDEWSGWYPGAEDGWDPHVNFDDLETPPVFRGQSLLDPVEPILNARCPQQCSGNGLCNREGKCSCELGFTGGSCETKLDKVGNQTKAEYEPMDGEQFATEYECHAQDHGNVINEDLNPWMKSGINKQLIDESVKLKFRCAIIQIINNIAYRATKKTSTPLRWAGFKNYINNLLRRTPLPDLEFVMCFDDRPLSFLPDMWPVFSYYKSLAHSDILMPGSFHYDEFLGSSEFRLHFASSKYSWEKKVEKCIWRGTANGNWKGNPYSVSTFPFFPRPRLVQLSAEYPDLIDAGFTGTYSQRPEVMKLIKPFMKKKMDMDEQINSKYMVVIDGNGSSDRYHSYLESGSVVIKPIGPYYEFFHSWPIPYKHYIPVKYDLSDLIYKLEWAKEHDDYAKRISEHSTSWSRNHLRLEEIYCYTWRLLNTYSRLLTYKVTLREGAVAISEFDNS